MTTNDTPTASPAFGRRSLFARMAVAVVAGMGLSNLLPPALRSLMRTGTPPLSVTIHPSAVSRSNKESSAHGA